MAGKTAQSRDQDYELLVHIKGLGLGTVEEYQEWCVQNGFSKKRNKHKKLRRREHSHSQAVDARKRLTRQNREKHVGAIAALICEGRLSEQDVSQPHFRRFCRMLRPAKGRAQVRRPNQEALRQLVDQLCQSRAKLFDGVPVVADFGDMPGNTYLEALVQISAYRRSWIRRVQEWKCGSHSARRQFASLLRHLFVQYELPLFFDAVWFAQHSQEATKRRGWYLHVGRGQNIRNCLLPIPYTKRMAHHFMQAPDDSTFEQAMRWGQVFGLGGGPRLAQAILASRMTEDFGHHEFWESVIRWFVAHTPLDPAHVAAIVDYLHHQRFVPQHVYVEGGSRQQAPPPQPNLTMRGRTLESLLRKVEEWHRRLGYDNTHQVRQWRPSGIEGFEFPEGDPDSPHHKIWTIRELTSSKALLAEGRQLSHCVATYASICANGRSSIWTMEYESASGSTKVLTIEVRSAARLIYEARGKANRMPTEKERKILGRWATKAGLSVAEYV